MRVILHIEDVGDSIGMAFAMKVADRVRQGLASRHSYLPMGGAVFTPEDESIPIAAIAYPTMTGFAVRMERQEAKR